MNVVWESVVMVLTGVFLLRVAGRKSISQMSLAQTVIMISIGSIIIQPIIESSLWKTMTAASVFILVLVIIEGLQLKFNAIEAFITGKARIVVENGVVNQKELAKLRLSVDQLEMFLRQQGITSFADIKTATIEPNGQLGYELVDDAKPLTLRDLKRILHPSVVKQVPDPTPSEKDENLFREINEIDSNPSSTLK
ncbi:DUF421 domain-containing protein [Pontibacillus salicampi]|uniref:DUF421 domain-containing protein n=1 Tax=Pontibacillus salicampi TaxID=1449801 RepID=A0ABV6LU36_9BACI